MLLHNKGVAHQVHGTKNTRKMNLGVLALAVCGFFLAALHPARADEKRIIWWNTVKGPTEITAQDLQNGSQTFDGFVVQNVHGTQDGKGDGLAWEAFTDRRYTIDPNDGSGDNIADSVAALVNLPPTPMPERFLRINASPYNNKHFSWVDDGFWDNVVNNLQVASAIIAKAHLKGIYFDTEPYHRGTDPNLYWASDFLKDPRYAGMSKDDLDRLVEKRGNQIIRALNKYSPRTSIIVSFSSITISQHTARNKSQDSLLAYLLDGMLDASTPDTTFIDGFESGYWHNDDPNYFNFWTNNIKNPKSYNVRFQKYPDKFMRQYQVAVGFFLDRDRDEAGHFVDGWCGDDKANMFYSPGRLAFTIQQAALAADKYVWVYSKIPNAWLPPDSPGGIPSVYVKAIRDGMAHANDLSLPLLLQNTSDEPESAVCK